MIQITRKLALELRAVLRRACGVTNKAVGPPVKFTAGAAGLTVRAQGPTAAVEYHAPGTRDSDEFVVPYACLADCEGRCDEPVTLERSHDQLVCRWHDGGVPQDAQFAVPKVARSKFPPLPDDLAENPGQLLAALREASDTTDIESTRFALGNVQLQAGKVLATDAHQLFIHAGFRFPWTGEVRIPRNAVFASKELPTDQPIRIGKSGKWLTLCTGPWTLHLAIDMEGRFPRIEDHVQAVSLAKAHLQLAPEDAQFLVQTVKRLPCGGDDYNLPVTVDLNGSVAIRAKSQAGEQPTEIILNRSRWTGDPLRFNTNRHYLARAAQLGFRDLYVFGAEAPVQCLDAERAYAWAVLNATDVVLPSAEAIRIESAGEPAAVSASSLEPKPRRPMVQSTTSSNGNGSANASQEPDVGTETLVEQAEAVKESLRDSLSKVNELVAGLKRHRKQNKLVRTTLATLRQLQEVS